MRFPTAFWKSGTAVFDPATLALSGWWRASYAGSPWTPTASAGGSGGVGNLAEATNPPATGTAQNGYTPADADGVNDQLTNGTAWSTLFTAGAGSIACLFLADAVDADTTAYQLPALLVDGTSGWNGLHVSTSGVRGYIDDGATKSVAVAASTGAYHLAQMKWDGANLKVNVDSVGWSSVACGNASNLTDSLAVGRNYASAAWFDGRILEIMTAASTLSDGDFDNIKSYMAARYGLSL